MRPKSVFDPSLCKRHIAYLTFNAAKTLGVELGTRYTFKKTHQSLLNNIVMNVKELLLCGTWPSLPTEELP